MRIFDKLKRMYYRYKNNDPFYNCDCFKNESCYMVDGPFVIFQNAKFLQITWVKTM